MTLILNQSDYEELWKQAPKSQPDNLLDDFEELTGVPECLGRGYSSGMELLPGVWLSFLDYEYHQDLIVKVPAHAHLIEIGVFLSGFLGNDIHPTLGGSRGYFSGSGVSPAYAQQHQGGQRLTCVNVEIEPELLDSFFLDDRQRYFDTVRQLFKGEDWKVSFYPTGTLAMRSLAQQLWNAPYRGAAKRMYLQAKVFELLAMHLDLISGDSAQIPYSPGLKPDTIARLHHAKEILATQFENPPSLVELAQQVGIGDRTLRRGFRELFGTTVIGYLTQQRMQRAKQLLQEGQWTVAEVARTVGYGHLGHFAAAFKRQFGVTPRECLVVKRLG